jgi:hypothetical protein
MTSRFLNDNAAVADHDSAWTFSIRYSEALLSECYLVPLRPETKCTDIDGVVDDRRSGEEKATGDGVCPLRWSDYRTIAPPSDKKHVTVTRPGLPY